MNSFCFSFIRSLSLGWICALYAISSGNLQQILSFTIGRLNNFPMAIKGSHASDDKNYYEFFHPLSFIALHSLDHVSRVSFPSSELLGFCLLVYYSFFSFSMCVCVYHVRLERSASSGMDLLVHPVLFAPLCHNNYRNMY